MISRQIKHATASMFVMHKSDSGWRMVFVHHKKFNKWMIPGGHVEPFENPLQAALRETHEETKTSPRLISFIHMEIKDTDSSWLLPPEYFFEQRIPARPGEAEHYHLDSCYVGVVTNDEIAHRSNESNDIAWFSLKEITESTAMFTSTQHIAIELLQKLENRTQFTYQF